MLKMGIELRRVPGGWISDSIAARDKGLNTSVKIKTSVQL